MDIKGEKRHAGSLTIMSTIGCGGIPIAVLLCEDHFNFWSVVIIVFNAISGTFCIPMIGREYFRSKKQIEKGEKEYQEKYGRSLNES